MTAEERIKNRKIGIVGMARSGMAAASLALEWGGQPFVSDCASASKLARETAQLKRKGIPFETDRHSERLLACDYLVASPGVPPDIEILRKAREKGIPIFSELEFAFWACRGKVIAVTGSNGKTTTTTLIGEIFKAAGYESSVCGNIGLPLSEVVSKTNENSVTVVEVSTFQLEAIADFKPYVAVILNLSPDHLDRHGSFEGYKALKYRITENQTAEDFLVLNKDDVETMNDVANGVIAAEAKKVFFTTTDTTGVSTYVKDGFLYTSWGGTESKVIHCHDILIPGPHNLQNAAAAACVATLFEITASIIEDVLHTFPGVEHRLERIGRVAGVNFVNDSKATNIDSVCWALRSIDTPIYLIAGGRDKGNDYEPVIKCGQGKIRSVIAIGEAKDRIFNELGKAFAVEFAESVDEAVHKGFELAHPGETVLLSPGCASFDMFENYEHRGRVFKEAVARLKNGVKKNETISQ